MTQTAPPRELARVLGLNTKQLRVLTALHKAVYTLPDLAKAARVPRTSLYYMLRTLGDRELITKEKRGNTWYYRATPITQTLDTLEHVLQCVSETLPQSATTTFGKHSNVIVHKHNNGTLESIATLAHMPRGTRWFGIQPRTSLLHALTKNPADVFIALNTEIKKRHHIVEAALHESGTELLWKALPASTSEQLLRSVGGRSADTARLPEHFLGNTAAEVYLCGSTVLLVNWKEGFSVSITDPDVFALLKGMFDSTKYLLERYDQNDKIARRLLDIQ